MSESKPVKKDFPPRWAHRTFLALLTMGVLIGILLGIQNVTDTHTAQANADSLAQDIRRVCETSGSLQYQDRDICKKAEQVQANPGQPIAGPKGDKGDKGDPGDDGATGSTGAKGDTGTAGRAGSAGTKGADGLTGAAGDDGKDGAQGLPGTAGAAGAKGDTGAKGEPGPKGDTGAVGPQGPAGKDGADGAAGAAVQSFTFTDASGISYTCTPNPPGSQTYTCAPLGAPEPTGAP